MDATSKFLSLGRGTNPLYICYAELKRARYMSAHNGIHEKSMRAVDGNQLCNLYVALPVILRLGDSTVAWHQWATILVRPFPAGGTHTQCLPLSAPVQTCTAKPKRKEQSTGCTSCSRARDVNWSRHWDYNRIQSWVYTCHASARGYISATFTHTVETVKVVWYVRCPSVNNKLNHLRKEYIWGMFHTKLGWINLKCLDVSCIVIGKWWRCMYVLEVYSYLW